MTEDITNDDIVTEEEEFNFDDISKDIMRDASDDDDIDEHVDNKIDDDIDDADDEDIVDDEEDIEDDAQVKKADLDYKALYDQVTAHNASLQSNLNSVEARFQAWQKQMEEDKQNQQKESADNKAQAAQQEIDEDLEDLMLEYPDLVPYVQKLIESKVSNKVSGVEERVAQLVEQRVKPIATRVQESEVQAHQSAIRKSHPDLDDIVNDNRFTDWLNNLPSYQRIGAYQVCDHGTADEVVSLLDNYKSAIGTKSPSKNDKTSTKTASTKKVVDKLKDAMHVKSAPSDVNMNASDDTTDPAKLFAQAAKDIMKEDTF